MQACPSGVACVSIIGPDDSLMFIDKYTSSNTLDLDYLVFCSLDHFPVSKAHKAGKGEKVVVEIPLNHQEYCVWGYRSSLKYRIIIVSQITFVGIDASLRSYFEKIKDYLFEALTNPFYNPFSPIRSTIFQNRIQSIFANSSNEEA